MTMTTLRDLAQREDLFVSGHGLCPGCAIPSLLRIVLRATKHPITITNATGCLQKASTKYPRTSWKLNWIHSTRTNPASTISGVEVMYKSLKKQGKLAVDKEIKFLAIGGDGVTYDSGFGSFSGAIERGHNFVYLCYDNQLNASTGGHRSSSSPMGVSTRTTPSGSVLPGKLQFRKDISRIIGSHKIPYLAQSAPWRWQDLFKKAEKAFETDGPSYLNVLSPCPTKWKIPANKTIEFSKLAADTCVWPLYEIKHGFQLVVNYKPKKKLPVKEWLEPQERFRHLFKTDNKWVVEQIQQEVDKDWEMLLSLENKTTIN